MDERANREARLLRGNFFEKGRLNGSIDQTLGTTHVGSDEATREMELHMTDTDHRGAAKEAPRGA